MAKSWKTRLVHTDVKVPEGYRSLTTAVQRGSTTVFRSAAAATDQWDQYKVGYTYGLYGTPTTLELAARICELEKGKYTVLAPGGQAAIALMVSRYCTWAITFWCRLAFIIPIENLR